MQVEKDVFPVMRRDKRQMFFFFGMVQSCNNYYIISSRILIQPDWIHKLVVYMVCGNSKASVGYI